MPDYTVFTNLKVTGEIDLPAASTTAKGTVKQGAAVSNAAGANPTAAEFKSLLDSLRAAGIIAST